MCHAGNIALILSVEVQLHLHSPHIWTLDQQSVTFKLKKDINKNSPLFILKKKKKKIVLFQREGGKSWYTSLVLIVFVLSF